MAIISTQSSISSTKVDDLRKVMENINISAFVLAEDGKLLYANPACNAGYHLYAGDQIDCALESDNRSALITYRHSLNNPAQRVELTAVIDLAWQDQPARLILLGEQKTAQSAADEFISSQRMFRTLISNLPGMAYRCRNDENWTMEFISERCFELTGYPVEDLLNNRSINYVDLIVNEDRVRVNDEVNLAIEENRPYQLLYRIHTKSGQEKWVWEQGRGIYNQAGELFALEGLIMDVTDRQTAAAGLQESESRYRSLVQASPDAIVLTDLDGRILLCNNQFCQLTAVASEKELIGTQIIDFIILQDRSRSLRSIQDLFTKNQPFAKLGTMISVEGRRVPIEANVAQVFDTNGIPQAYLGIIRDVTQRELDQRTIRANEARYRAIVEDNPEMIVRYQADGLVTFANATYCQYYGLERQELVGKKLLEALPESAHGILKKILEFVSPQMPPAVKEVSISSAKGEKRWFRWTTRPILDEDQQFIEYQSVGEDITDQKKAEEALRESESRLRELLENVKLVALILDIHGTVRFCNSFYCDLSGFQKENVIGQNWLEKFVPIDDAIAFKKVLLESAITGKIPARYENLILTSQGEQRLIAWNNTILRDSQGMVTGIASIGQDITERNFSEKIQSAIYKISEVTNEANNLDELFESIHQVLLELMPAENFFIALYDQKQDLISFPYYVDQFDTAPLPAKPDHGLTEYVLRTGKSILVNPEVFNLLVEENEVENVGTPSVDWLGVPLKVENRIIGVMGTQSYTEGIRYQRRDEQMFAFVSTQIAMAIERKRVAQELSTSQQRNQLLVAASTDAIFLEKLSGKILDCNSVAEQMYGYSRDELLALNVSELVPEEMQDRLQTFVAEQVEKGGLVTEALNRRSDGSVFPVEISTRLMTIEGDQVVVVYVRDITERKRVENAIVESEAKFRALAETAAAGIFIHRGENFLYVNPMWCRITGFTEEELLSKKIYELVLDSNRDEIRDLSKIRLENGSAIHQYEYEVVTKKGARKWVDFNVGLIDYEGQKAIIGTAVDVTARKQREHELEVISQMSETMRTGITRAEILPRVLEQLMDLVNVNGAMVSTYENHGSESVFIRAIGNLKMLDGIKLNVKDGLSGHIIATGKSYRNDDAASDPYFAFPELLQGMSSLAGVPLINQGKTVGALIICAEHPLEEFEMNLLPAIGDMTASALHRSDLYDQTRKQADELKNAYEATLEGWTLALELRDKETKGHSMRIATLTLKLARRMGIPEGELEKVWRGALLHDIGKMGIPDTILLKPGTLTEAEWKIMQKHPVYARDMLSQIPFFRESIDIPYYHHEWWDGSGYPQGLEGQEIPLVARIFAIVDSWDALISNRPYRKAWQRNEALAHLVNQAGTHFDPAVVDAFVKMLKEEGYNPE